MFKTNDKHTQNSIFDATNWMDPAIKKKLDKSWAPIFYEHVFCMIDETPFAVLYDTTGKPNVPVNILLSLEYIKHMRVDSDSELIDSFYFDYLVNYALGIRTLGGMNLAPRTLYYFRERVYKYLVENPDKEDLLFGQFINLCKSFAKKAGISFDEQRTDTTLFMSNIKKAGRMSLAYDVLCLAVQAVPKVKLSAALSQVLEPGFKTDMLYRSKSNEAETKLTMILNLCKEALDILEALPEMKESDEARIVRRFLEEQSIPDPEEDRVVPKPKNKISSDSLQSAYDEDATYRTKGKVSQSGYVLEVSETCKKENPFQLITDYTVAPNNTSDVEIIKERLETVSDNTGCTDMYMDGGFHFKDVHKMANENGVNVHLTDMTGREPTKKLPVTDFDIDPKSNEINKCPAGYVSFHSKAYGSQTTGHFSHDACSDCVLFDKCYSKKLKKDYVVRISLSSLNTARKRIDMKENRVEYTSKRAGIEGTNSALKRKGQAKLAVRGKNKVTVVSGLKVMAQNIKRFIKYKQGGYAVKNITIPMQGNAVPVSG